MLRGRGGEPVSDLGSVDIEEGEKGHGHRGSGVGDTKYGTWFALALVGLAFCICGFLYAENVSLKSLNSGLIGRVATAEERVSSAEQEVVYWRQQQTPQVQQRLPQAPQASGPQSVVAPCPSTKPCPNSSPFLQSPTASKPWLLIGIPTVPRRDGSDYLNQALDYILEQLPPYDSVGSVLRDRVQILVMNNARGAEHHAFQLAQDRLRSHPKGKYVLFATNTKPPEPGSDRGNANVPGAKVRQQSRDVVTLLEAAMALEPELYMFMEDDFRMCPHALMALQYLVEQAYAVDEDWFILRVCYGLNGAVTHGKDLKAFKEYLENNLHRRPPDHLLVEWHAQEKPEPREYANGRTYVTSRYNLFEHFGHVSTLRTAGQGALAGCYDFMEEPVLFGVEAFKMDTCSAFDVSPCAPAGNRKPRNGDEDKILSPPIPFGLLQKKMQRVSKGVHKGSPTDKGLGYC